MWGVEWNAGFRGKALSWSRLERILSGKQEPELHPIEHCAEVEEKKSVRFYSSRPWVELHAAGSYNFLRGASEPQQMVDAAIKAGICALSLQDRDGFYGAIAFAEAAEDSGVATVFGAELSLDYAVLTLLCKSPEGYRRASRLMTHAHMSGSKDQVRYPALSQIARELDGHCYVLAGVEWLEQMEQLVDAFGAKDVLAEYVVGMCPDDVDAWERLDGVVTRLSIGAVATSRACAASFEDAPVAQAKQALARRMDVMSSAGDLHPMGATWLRRGEVIAEVLGPQREYLMDAAVAIARECAFALRVVRPNLPRWEVPDGHDESSWLAQLVWERFEQRYGGREAGIIKQAKAQISHELAVIDELGFPGYFLIVTDLVDFARAHNILCQGRGSAANSAVCFALGITNVEPIAAGLLFERFLSADREGPPDIDIDCESGRREEVIQYVYSRYGRENAAQVANVITYRYKGALRDAARALGYPPGASDGWSKQVTEAPSDVAALAQQLRGQPRHLGIHSGGMVICDRPIADVVPVEWARMKDRSIVQWDKEGCAWAGLVKFDLLGLGMLEALHHMIDLVAQSHGITVQLWELDMADPKVYDMLCAGDAVGVFQVESRAQLATLPRLKPRCFFDLVVEVALIRPGPIQGGSVHPYLRRRNGEEPVSFEHPVLEKSLAKTLGIPLFQEQLMQIAVDAAGLSGGEADQLRRAMGSKRSPQRMAALKQRFYQGLESTSGITGEVADVLWNKVVAFAAYGFPESHAQSFAALVFFSAWFKCYYPAEFCVGLLKAQPMGFYSPQSLLADARRHNVRILPVSVNHSRSQASIENGAIRLGLDLVKGLSHTDDIVAHAPYNTVAELARRAHLQVNHVEALAKAGALDCLGVDRRQALWQAGVAATEHDGMLEGLSSFHAPSLPGMNAFELLVADIAATGVSHDKHPMVLLRSYLDAQGVTPANKLLEVEDAHRIWVAGIVTHRQRPATAGTVTFLGMEDETGLMNIVVSAGLWEKQKKIARTAKALMVRGIVSNANQVASINADKLVELRVGEVLSRRSRDFH
ncbi:MAG: error-prone DNA polymerase [Corynebacterium sp.]|uniref:error-prone DNA polymerase n=1 Tax=Corynebacterium sp. TaxID=1720 RepID=UPI0026DDA432|nr:error-prone DNA polymerase [Corynebacterium sp.]MDO4762630.1 error-prone DNA polymerase [Corynebacterium sp.]